MLEIYQGETELGSRGGEAASWIPGYVLRPKLPGRLPRYSVYNTSHLSWNALSSYPTPSR